MVSWLRLSQRWRAAEPVGNRSAHVKLLLLQIGGVSARSGVDVGLPHDLCNSRCSGAVSYDENSRCNPCPSQAARHSIFSS